MAPRRARENNGGATSRRPAAAPPPTPSSSSDPQPGRRAVTAVAGVTRAVHNIHPLGRDGQITYCDEGNCERCGDFNFLASRAEREFGCILVRPDATPSIQVDNDDNDPQQPSYAEDYEAFDMICNLEAEKEKLQKAIEDAKNREKANDAKMRKAEKQLDTLKEQKLENTKLKRQIASAKKVEADLRMQLRGSNTLFQEERAGLRKQLEELQGKHDHLQQNMLKVEQRKARRAARREKRKSKAGETRLTPATPSSGAGGHALTQQGAALSPLVEEPFEGVPFDGEPSPPTPTPITQGQSASMNGAQQPDAKGIMQVAPRAVMEAGSQMSNAEDAAASNISPFHEPSALVNYAAGVTKHESSPEDVKPRLGANAWAMYRAQAATTSASAAGAQRSPSTKDELTGTSDSVARRLF